MNSNQEWETCVPGDLIRLASRAKSQEIRRRIILGGGVTMTLLLVGAFLIPRLLEDSTEPNYGGIRCSAVRSQAQTYLAGGLNANTRAKISSHLQMCPLCESYVKNLETNQVSQPVPNICFEQFVSFQTNTPAKCGCPHCLGSGMCDRLPSEIR